MTMSALSELIEESINLELSVAALYKLFANAYPEDHGFWWQLHLEEKSHAALLRSGRDSFVKRDKFPLDLIDSSTEDLKASIAKVENLIHHCKTTLPNQLEACKMAIELENESGEMHYTQFMKKDPDNSLETVFQQLNRNDKNHEERIRAHCLTIVDTVPN